MQSNSSTSNENKQFRDEIIRLVEDGKKIYNLELDDKEIEKLIYNPFDQTLNRRKTIRALQAQLDIDNNKNADERYDDDLFSVLSEEVKKIDPELYLMQGSSLKDNMLAIMENVKFGKIRMKKKPRTMQSMEDTLSNICKNEANLLLFTQYFTDSISNAYSNSYTGPAKHISRIYELARYLGMITDAVSKAKLLDALSIFNPGVVAIAQGSLNTTNNLLPHTSNQDPNILSNDILMNLAEDCDELLELIYRVLIATLRVEKTRFLIEQPSQNVISFAVKLSDCILSDFVEKNANVIKTPCEISKKLQDSLESHFNNLQEYKTFLARLNEEKKLENEEVKRKREVEEKNSSSKRRRTDSINLFSQKSGQNVEGMNQSSTKSFSNTNG